MGYSDQLRSLWAHMVSTNCEGAFGVTTGDQLIGGGVLIGRHYAVPNDKCTRCPM